MIFDTHAHYDDSQFDADREEVLAGLPAAGVTRICDVSASADSLARVRAIADSHDFAYGAVGLHPDEVGDLTPAVMAEMREDLKDPKIAAVGEIGLDYHWEENPPKEHQWDVLRRQLALATELDLPVIIHDRDAHADCFAIVSEFPTLRGVFHCYSGSVEMARELWKRGWYVGFDGPLTYKNARKTVEVAAEAPLDKILIETDSPYLSPVPLRGTRNDSRNLVHVAAKLAELRGMTPEEIIALTMENGKRLFGIA